MLFLYYASLDVAFSVTDQVDLNTFDDKTIDMWGKIDTELMRLLIALSARKNQRLLHNWIRKHSSNIAKVNSYLIWVAPNIVIERLQAGCTLDLETLEWDHNVRLLNQVAKKDKQLSIKILQDNRALLIKCLNELIPNQHEKLPKFIDYLETFAKEELKAILEGIEPSGAERYWLDRLEGKRDERKAVTRLIKAINDHVSDKELRRWVKNLLSSQSL